MSEALNGLQAQAELLTLLDSEQHLAGTSPGFARWMEIKYQAGECYKELTTEEYSQATEILSPTRLAEADQRYGTVR